MAYLLRAVGRKEVLLDDPANQPDEGACMQFRLTYEGPLFSTQRDSLGSQKDKQRENKHHIRRSFHPQLKRLWEITPFLKNGERSGPSVWITQGSPDSPVYDQQSLAARHSLYGWNFVPLVTHELNLSCGLDILFLRPDPPGSVLQSGDIDNRLKTLFDAMRLPVAGEEYAQRRPALDEMPMFCLLEEDRLITKISVETDQLLQFSKPGMPDLHEVRLVITVHLRPQEMHLGNMQFG